jgi:hypothetical protein
MERISEKVDKVLEIQRSQSGIESEKFLWLHAACTVKEETVVLNSSENDPASGDPIPEFKTTLVCASHGVASASY